MSKINRTHYKELHLMLWDWHSKWIEERYAYIIYITRACWIDPAKILKKEKALIKKLKRKYEKKG